VAPAKIIIEAQQLRKSYGAKLALECVTLDVKAGEVVGLLGPNGAGKTTTLSILATVMVPDSGSLRILGLDARAQRVEIRRHLGFVPQSIALYPSLSAAENLELFLRVHGLSRRAARDGCANALELVELASRAADPVATLSGGMQRRLNLACGIAHEPEILLLDEPSIGVDPQSREHILRAIRSLADAGAAVVYSTHYMEEVERLCDRVFLIDQGRVVASGTIAEVIAIGGGHPRIDFTFAGDTPQGWFEGIDAVELASPRATSGRVTLALASVDSVPELLQRSRHIAGGLQEFTIRSPNLSDAFMALTGHSLRTNETT
jgi:ABC-2 type transport system ATP-binding protein